MNRGCDRSLHRSGGGGGSCSAMVFPSRAGGGVGRGSPCSASSSLPASWPVCNQTTSQSQSARFSHNYREISIVYSKQRRENPMGMAQTGYQGRARGETGRRAGAGFIKNRNMRNARVTQFRTLYSRVWEDGPRRRPSRARPRCRSRSPHPCRVEPR